MASETLDFSGFGRHLLFGVSVGLGLGVGIGAGIVVARRYVTLKANDGSLVVCMSELTREIKALRAALSSQRTVTADDRPIRPVKHVRSANSLHVRSDDDSDEEFFEMSDDDQLTLPTER